MTYDYHFYTELSLEQLRNAFPDWDTVYATAAYNNWLELFNKRAGFLYRGQLRIHEETLARQFCNQHGLGGYTENISEQGYTEPWERYAYEQGLDRHREEAEHHTNRLKAYWEGLYDNGKPRVTTDREALINYMARLESKVPGPTGPYMEELIMSVWFNTTFNNNPAEAKRLRSLPYPEYLQSNHWRRVRCAIILAHGARCQHERCDIADSYWFDEKWIHVHHLSYKNRGNERFEDLTLLCNECHKLEHGIPL